MNKTIKRLYLFLLEADIEEWGTARIVTNERRCECAVIHPREGKTWNPSL